MRLGALWLAIVALGICIDSPGGVAQERQIGGVGVTIFTDRNFRGRSATLREDTPDLRTIGLNDVASSLRVGPDEQWEVCEHANYEGRCVVVSGSESDLRRSGWNKMISSARRLRGGVRPPTGSADAYIVLFDQRNFRGKPRNYKGAEPRLSGRVESVTIGIGVWELCEHWNFTGRCVTLDSSAPDLSRYGMRNRVASVRPVGRQPR
jgi:Beta/Gamma crystallin